MARDEGSITKEIKRTIQDRLRGTGVDVDSLHIIVSEGPEVIIRGEVGSHGEKEQIIDLVMEAAGIDDVIDYLVVPDDYSDDIEQDDYHSADLRDPDEEFMGTEDAARSVEDGIPYIPPTKPSYQRPSERIKWKRKKRAL